MLEKHHFYVMMLLNPVSHSVKTPPKNQKLGMILYLRFNRFKEQWIILMYHSPLLSFLNMGSYISRFSGYGPSPS